VVVLFVLKILMGASEVEKVSRGSHPPILFPIQTRSVRGRRKVIRLKIIRMLLGFRMRSRYSRLSSTVKCNCALDNRNFLLLYDTGETFSSCLAHGIPSPILRDHSEASPLFRVSGRTKIYDIKLGFGGDGETVSKGHTILEAHESKNNATVCSSGNGKPWTSFCWISPESLSLLTTSAARLSSLGKCTN